MQITALIFKAILTRRNIIKEGALEFSALQIWPDFGAV